MRKIRTFINSYLLVISLALLAGFFLSCGLVQAQFEEKEVLNQIRPEIQAKLQALEKEIAQKGYPFTVGYSPAMEYSISQLCGLVEPKDWRRFAAFEKTEAYLAELPSSWDWRNSPGGTTPVRSQGGCGSCWAFGTVGPLEFWVSYLCGKVEDLSEQYLVSCNEDGWSCSGGWFAHDYHQWKIPRTKNESDAGAVLEANFLYKGSDVACNGPHAHAYKINSWTTVDGYPLPSVAAIKQAIYNHGPVSAAVCVGSQFQGYHDGIFVVDDCSYGVNHAVTLVGWNDNPSDPANGYWILKNSWGTGWGMSGYMHIRYGVSKVGYAANYIDFSNCNSIPPAPGLDCAGAPVLTLGVLYSGLTTVGSDANVSTYNLGGRNESGPENVYQVTTTKTGDLTATLSGFTTDLDVFILNACDPNSARAFGESTAKYANAPAGTYYIVVDGNSGASGSFNLQTALATALPDLTGNFVSISSYSGGRVIYATLKVSNIGGANAGKFNVAYYVSSDGVNRGSYLGSQTASAGLSVGKVLYLYPRFTSTTALTGKYIMAVIDYDARISESNEMNNVAVGGKVKKVSLKQLP